MRCAFWHCILCTLVCAVCVCVILFIPMPELVNSSIWWSCRWKLTVWVRQRIPKWCEQTLNVQINQLIALQANREKKDKQTTQNICCNRFEVNYTWLNRQLKWTSFIWIVFVWPKFINMKKWLFLSRQWARYTQVNDTSGVLICMIWQCPNISLQIDWWPFSMDILMFCFVYI